MKKDSSRKNKTAEPNRGVATTAFQVFTVAEVHRRDLKNAPYNPRTITQDAKRRLREVIERVGLVQPIVWNKRTGNIVGGHQRIQALDALEGTQDYVLTCAVVDVDEVREREINVALNAPQVCGDFDLEKLQEVLDTEGLELEAAGFNLNDIMRLFGEVPQIERKEERRAMVESLKSLREAYEEMHKSLVSLDDRRFYTVLVFESNDHRRRVMQLLGYDDAKYVDGRILERFLSKSSAHSGGQPEKLEGSGQGDKSDAPDGANMEKVEPALVVADAVQQFGNADQPSVS
jgi:hypothetical protein